ncbi:MAG: hypothetical protein ACSLEL_01800 [Candidatus Malihini olakiniferum]
MLGNIICQLMKRGACQIYYFFQQPVDNFTDTGTVSTQLVKLAILELKEVLPETGNHPGKTRTSDELHATLKQAFRLLSE